jgi:hypothetical protein
MTMRTTEKTITFHRPFCLKGVDRLLPPADYRVMTDEELIEGLSFPAYPSGIDRHLRASAVWIRSRDGIQPPIGLGIPGPSRLLAQRLPFA